MYLCSYILKRFFDSIKNIYVDLFSKELFIDMLI